MSLTWNLSIVENQSLEDSIQEETLVKVDVSAKSYYFIVTIRNFNNVCLCKFPV